MKNFPLFFCILISSSIVVYGDTTKATLLPNRTIVYNKLPSTVDSFSKMFQDGIFYGRIRSNNFYFDWESEVVVDGKLIRKDNYSAAIGGSFTYKSALYKGWSVEASMYASEPFFHMDKDDVAYVKSGKDTFSRYEVVTADNWGMYSLAVANIAYQFSATKIQIGRVLFESLLTSSNDSKMIPNSFEGMTFISKDIPHSTFKLAYLTRQKLRNHSSFHDVITYGKDLNGDGTFDSKAEVWANNDDSMIHKGLSEINLKAHNKSTHNSLVVAQLDNDFFQNLHITLNYTAVPELFSLAIGELSYKRDVFGIKIKPSIRYIRQFDNGAGAVGGSSLSTDTTGYTQTNSLESYLVAAKIQAIFSSALKCKIAYSYVANKADIVAPWRGFPTKGYTRAMGQYNWYANTKTWLFRIDYDLEKAHLLDGVTTMFRYAYEDFDEAKKLPMTDSNVYNFDVVYQPRNFVGFDTKLRIGIVDAKNFIATSYAPSYTEYRLEFNYLF